MIDSTIQLLVNSIQLTICKERGLHGRQFPVGFYGTALTQAYHAIHRWLTMIQDCQGPDRNVASLI